MRAGRSHGLARARDDHESSSNSAGLNYCRTHRQGSAVHTLAEAVGVDERLFLIACGAKSGVTVFVLVPTLELSVVGVTVRGDTYCEDAEATLVELDTGELASSTERISRLDREVYWVRSPRDSWSRLSAPGTRSPARSAAVSSRSSRAS